MSSSSIEWDIEEPVGIVTINRPAARNALTWAMYDALVAACDAAEADGRVRVLIIRGAGGVFAAGTDIAQFAGFDGEAGVAYEKRLDAVIDRIERLPLITIAVVDGVAAGGGCAIAMACDLRICSDRAQFGVPVARTLGNCLSISNTARMVDLLGAALTRDLLLSARLISAEDALAAGFVRSVVPADVLPEEAGRVARELARRAPSTVLATKQTLLRLRDHRRPRQDAADDVIRECYGSAEFREGVAAFLESRRPSWLKTETDS
jgi:enoyl-CoA hydratase/carnithine racemase